MVIDCMKEKRYTQNEGGNLTFVKPPFKRSVKTNDDIRSHILSRTYT